MRQVKTTWRERGGVMNLEVECAADGRGRGAWCAARRRADGRPPGAGHPGLGAGGDPHAGTIRYDGRTDGAGRFRMRWFGGDATAAGRGARGGIRLDRSLRGAGRPGRPPGDAAAGPTRLDRGPAGPEAGRSVDDGRPGSSGRRAPRRPPATRRAGSPCKTSCRAPTICGCCAAGGRWRPRSECGWRPASRSRIS